MDMSTYSTMHCVMAFGLVWEAKRGINQSNQAVHISWIGWMELSGLMDTR